MHLSGDIRRNLRDFGINYNEDALHILTKKKIPTYLKVVASLGRNYSYGTHLGNGPDQKTAMDLLVTTTKVVDFCDTYHQVLNIQPLITGSMDGTFLNSDRAKHTKTQIYLQHLAKLSIKFLNENPDIIVVSADKGGKPVIMNKDSYTKKMHEHIDENIEKSTYSLHLSESLESLKIRMEDEYRSLISGVNMCGKLSIPGRIFTLLPEPFLVPRIYGCPKIHKASVPLRPIIASADMIGRELSGWLLECLKVIALHLKCYDVGSSLEVIPDFKNFKVEDGHKLSSYDYVSMFTNIDVDIVIDIVLEHYPCCLENITGIPPDVFARCLRFFTSNSAFFSFEGRIYKQMKGLAMGNRISQVLAEIRTNAALRKVLNRFDATVISCFYKYVDDIFSSIHGVAVEYVKEMIEIETNMEITLTEENGDNEVEFLDCIFKRCPDGSIAYRWFKKSCSSLSILNYHSAHPGFMKRNTVRQMIARARRLTSPQFASNTDQLLRKILWNSSYPDSYINEEMHIRIPDPRPDVINTNPDLRLFLSCPYSGEYVKNANRIIAENQINIKLALRPIAKNKDVLIKTMKDKRIVGHHKDCIFMLSCSSCQFRKFYATGSYDVERTAHSLYGTDPDINGHLMAFPGHSFNNPQAKKIFHKRSDMKHAHSILIQFEQLINLKKFSH